MERVLNCLGGSFACLSGSSDLMLRISGISVWEVLLLAMGFGISCLDIWDLASTL